MKFKKLGSTDLNVSLICLGTMTWGEQNTQEEGFEQMDYALDRGINFFDTAELYAIPPKEKTYGKTEEIIGNWFKLRNNREKVILASKIAGPGLKWIRGGGSQYSPKSIEEALHNSLKRHCTIPFEFICYSDNPNVKADVVIPLKPHSDIKKHWYKLSYFNPLFANQNPEDEIIIMDIDQVIVNNIDDMIGYPVGQNELVSYNKWWGGKPTYGLKLNAGFLKFRSGQLKIIWDEFIKSPEDWQLNWYKTGVVHHKYYGEQNFINWMCDTHKINLTLMPPEWVCKLTNDEDEDRENNIFYMKKFNKDYMILDKPNDDIKIVHFANPNANIHTSKYEWIKDYWK